MKKALLTTALIAATAAMSATTATAQGIVPVTTAPATDVTVGTLGSDNNALIALLAAAAILAAALHAADGSN